MAVASMHLGVWSWSRQSPELQTECQNGKERWFMYFFSMAWLLVTDWLVWVFHNLLSNWDFHAQPFLGFTKNDLKRKKHPVNRIKATICKSSPKLDSWRLEKCCLVWWVSISV